MRRKFYKDQSMSSQGSGLQEVDRQCSSYAVSQPRLGHLQRTTFFPGTQLQCGLTPSSLILFPTFKSNLHLKFKSTHMVCRLAQGSLIVPGPYYLSP